MSTTTGLVGSMLRVLLIVMFVAAVHNLCALSVRATCGDYLHTSSQNAHADSKQITETDADSNSGRCLSCQDSPDRPSPNRAPVTVQPVLDPAALGAGTQSLVRGEANEWLLYDEIAVTADPVRIDRPPRVC